MSDQVRRLAAKLETEARKIHPDFRLITGAAGEPMQLEDGRIQARVGLYLYAGIDVMPGESGDQQLRLVIAELRDVFRNGMDGISNLLGSLWRPKGEEGQWWMLIEERHNSPAADATVVLKRETDDESGSIRIPREELRAEWTRLPRDPVVV
jgi:hypothetical protein